MLWEAFGDGSTDLTSIGPLLADQTEARMREHLERFRNWGIIVRGGRFLQVQPAPLASRLGKQRLTTVPQSSFNSFELPLQYYKIGC